MVTVRKPVVALYVERSSGSWVVLDSDEKFWILPAAYDAWELRKPFEPTEESDLESVPGHYKYMLGLPS